MKRLGLVLLLCALHAAKGYAGETISRGRASWFGSELMGKKMANGKPCDPRNFTCASWQYDLGTKVRVTNVQTGDSVVVTVTDRGPAAWTGKIIDLSRAAFSHIGKLSDGWCNVTVEPLK